ncbi:MAG: sigma 54-interacting transcriptional regulator [Peptococcaceae bacterium]|nr:sigma 54-interacting transcriptional regulator [Peptococcaceae bacterium]
MLSVATWKEFIERGSLTPDIPPLIRTSWQRSKESNVDPFLKRAPLTVSPQDLGKYQQSNPAYLILTDDIKTQINSLLKQLRATITLANSDGLILYLDGDARGLKYSHENGYVPGAIWTETSVGTTCIGICLKLKKPVATRSYQHYCSLFHAYDAASYPVLSPTKELAGVVTIVCETGQVPAIDTITWLLASLLERVMKEADLNNQLSWQKCFSEYLFSEIPRAGLLVDADGRIILANSRAKAGLGTTPVNVSELENHWHHKINLNRDNKSLRFPVTKDEEIIIASNALGGKKVLWFEKKPVPEKSCKTAKRFNFTDLIGESKSFLDAMVIAEKAAASDVNVLLEGETGTGKEMFSQAIHSASTRNSGPLIAVNCGAIPRELVLSELFGYEEGTFTGAKKQGNAGKFELANGGTLFLDEIGELPPDVQVILLRVLQNREIVRLGGHKVIPIDVRIIAATNRDLLAEVNQGRFRRDLYYRLNVIKITLPPLRQRPEDILPLWKRFLKDSCYRLKKEVPETTMAVQKILCEYSWPGNIRELQNTAERTAVLVNGSILPEHLPFEITQKLKTPKAGTSLKVLERESILNTLDMVNGNKTQTAKVLGLSRPTLYRKLKEYELL